MDIVYLGGLPSVTALGVSTGGNTSGSTGSTQGTVVLAGGNNITLSQSTGASGATITISGANIPAATNFSAGVSTGGNTAGSTGITGTRVVLVGGNNITLSQSTDANGATVSISGGAGGGTTLSKYNPFPTELAVGFATSSHNPASINFLSYVQPTAVALSQIVVIKSINVGIPGATSQNSSGTLQFSYTQGATWFKRVDFGANSSNATTVASASFGLTAGYTYSSSSQSLNVSWLTDSTGGTTSASTTSSNDSLSNIFLGRRLHGIPFVTTLTAGEYFVAFQHSSTTATTGSNVTLLSISNMGVANPYPGGGWLTLGVNTAGATASYWPGGEGAGRASAITTNNTMALSVITTNTENFWYFHMNNHTGGA